MIQLIIGGVHELSEGGLIDIGPRGMAIIGPIVKNNALFLIGILLIPALMLLIRHNRERLRKLPHVPIKDWLKRNKEGKKFGAQALRSLQLVSCFYYF